MALTASALRSDVYRLLDRIIESGESLEIERKGHILKITPAKEPKGKLDNLTPHHSLNIDPEEIVHCDWSKEWNGDTRELL